jgi:hypothetical protein
MNLQLGRNYSVSAHCPDCGALTSFDQEQVPIIDGGHMYNGKNYMRVLYVFSQCARCGRGGLATVPDNGGAQSAVLEDFYPISIDAAPLPHALPPDIQAEFREGERCASFGASRAASALFRSVLEKTLMEVRLSMAFNTSAESWLNQQLQYDLWHAEKNRARLHVARLSAA